MTRYLVRWDIDMWADTPEAAAFLALQAMRDPISLATSFDVRQVTVNKRTKIHDPVEIDLERYAVCYSSTCRHIFKPKPSNNLAAIPKLLERIGPGGLVPSCECPKCGCLAYPALKMIQ